LDRPNVILLTVDSLRAGNLGAYGYGRPTSPSLDRLASDGLLFESAYACGPNTPHSFPSLLTGRYVLSGKRLGTFDAPVTLAEAFGRSGYETAAFVAGNPWLSRYYGWGRGFDAFHEFLEMGLPGHPVHGVRRQEGLLGAVRAIDRAAAWARRVVPRGSRLYRAGEVAKLLLKGHLISRRAIRNKLRLRERFYPGVLDWLREDRTRPFFLWVHDMEVHFPYLPDGDAQRALGVRLPSEWRQLSLWSFIRDNLFTDRIDTDRVVGLYDASIRTFDRYLGDLFATLERAGLRGRTVVAVTADHGEEFREHGGFQHQAKLHEELLRVPLVLWSPSRRAGRVGGPASLIDLAPTLLAEAGIEIPPSFRGRPLAAEGDERRPAISEACYGSSPVAPVGDEVRRLHRLHHRYGLRLGRWRYATDTGRPGADTLFDLDADPMETTNRAADLPDLAGALGALLENHRRENHRRLVRGSVGGRRRAGTGEENAP
jgi:arylsulfatase A-like enzyme